MIFVIKFRLDGQQLNYFDYHTNRLHEVQILEKKPQKVLVMDLDSKHVFTIRYYMVTTQPIFILNALVLLYNLEIEHNLK